jgi:hypothetical protein
MASYSIPQESKLVFQNGILKNPLMQKDLPAEIEEASRGIRFEGTDTPSLPINWRLAESISALKAFEAAVLNVLLKRKYGVEPKSATINTYVWVSKHFFFLQVNDPTSQRPRSALLHESSRQCYRS